MLIRAVFTVLLLTVFAQPALGGARLETAGEYYTRLLHDSAELRELNEAFDAAWQAYYALFAGRLKERVLESHTAWLHARAKDLAAFSDDEEKFISRVRDLDEPVVEYMRLVVDLSKTPDARLLFLLDAYETFSFFSVYGSIYPPIHSDMNGEDDSALTRSVSLGLAARYIAVGMGPEGVKSYVRWEDFYRKAVASFQRWYSDESMSEEELEAERIAYFEGYLLTFLVREGNCTSNGNMGGARLDVTVEHGGNTVRTVCYYGTLSGESRHVLRQSADGAYGGVSEMSASTRYFWFGIPKLTRIAGGKIYDVTPALPKDPGVFFRWNTLACFPSDTQEVEGILFYLATRSQEGSAANREFEEYPWVYPPYPEGEDSPFKPKGCAMEISFSVATDTAPFAVKAVLHQINANDYYQAWLCTPECSIPYSWDGSAYVLGGRECFPAGEWGVRHPDE